MKTSFLECELSSDTCGVTITLPISIRSIYGSWLHKFKISLQGNEQHVACLCERLGQSARKSILEYHQVPRLQLGYHNDNIFWSTENRYCISGKTPVISLHHQPMSSTHQQEAIGMIKCLRNILPKGVVSSLRRYTPISMVPLDLTTASDTLDPRGELLVSDQEL